MNLIAKYITTLKNAGKKPEASESQLNTYRLYDSIHTCTLSAYVKLVFRNDLNALIIEGNPPLEVLENAKNEIINEFSEASGNSRSGALTNCLHKIYRLRAKIACFNLCINLLQFNKTDELEKVLKSMRYKLPNNEKEKEALIKRIHTKIKSTSVSLSEEMNLYNSLVKDSKKSEYKESDFEKQLAVISKYMGFRIDKEKITLTEYASYLNNFNKEIEYGRQRNISKH